jgi:predicted phage terminase large subunit-like protein
MGALQYVAVPGYSALLLMKTYADLSLPKAGMSRSREWLSGTAARWVGETKTWHFPSGASLTFGYLDSEGDEQRYRTAEFQYIGFDELTRFQERPYRFLFSRLRRLAGSDVPVRMRAGTNPGDRGAEWVKKRFIPDEFLNLKDEGRFSRTWWKQDRLFVPARLEDNEHLDREDYEHSLDELDPITRAHLRRGDWNVYEGGRFLAEWFKGRYRLVNHVFGQRGELQLGASAVPLDRCLVFLTVDPAASDEALAKSDDPDYTVVSVWALTPGSPSQLVWLDCRRFRKEIPDIVPEIEEVYRLWRAEFVAVEAVASNRGVLQLAQRTSMAVREVSPRGKDKLVRATKAMTYAGQGRVWLPMWAEWLDAVEAEVFTFTGDPRRDAHDDIVDTLSYSSFIMDEMGGDSDGARPFVIGNRSTMPLGSTAWEHPVQVVGMGYQPLGSSGPGYGDRRRGS